MPSPLFQKCKNIIYSGTPKELQSLLQEESIGIFKEKDEYEDTLLHFAIKHDKFELVKILLGYGIDTMVTDKDGDNPLHTAVKRYRENGYQLNSVTALIESKKFDLNAKDKHGDTALHFAVKHTNLELTKLFVNQGADKEVKDEHGHTALEYAQFNNLQDILSILKCSGDDSGSFEVAREI